MNIFIEEFMPFVCRNCIFLLQVFMPVFRIKFCLLITDSQFIKEIQNETLFLQNYLTSTTAPNSSS